MIFASNAATTPGANAVLSLAYSVREVIVFLQLNVSFSKPWVNSFLTLSDSGSRVVECRMGGLVVVEFIEVLLLLMRVVRLSMDVDVESAAKQRDLRTLWKGKFASADLCRGRWVSGVFIYLKLENGRCKGTIFWRQHLKIRQLIEYCFC